MIIVLLGYMGSGKTAAGRLLSEKTGTSFIDLDDFIEQKEGMPIRDIFKVKGEIYFRKKEMLYLEELLSNKSENTVISLGGGTPCYGENMKLILEATKHVFYLNASITTLLERLLEERALRPVISHLEKDELEEFVRKHLFERNFYYMQASHKIDVNTRSLKEIVAEIKSLL